MGLLAVKLLVTPAVVVVASLVGRRWGAAVGGWIVGLPLTSGPVAVFLAVERGPDFAAQASAGSIAGVVAQAGFCLGYALAASRGWPAALFSGALGFAVCALALQAADLAPSVLFVVALASLAVTLWLLPRGAPPAPSVGVPGWELPARAAAVTALVVAVTTVAAELGARASGALACFPLIGGALGVFAHRAQGPRAGVAALRGMASALFAFAGFFVVVGLALPRADTVAAFSLATVVALIVQAATLKLARAA
jgi:hypothetical protein